MLCLLVSATVLPQSLSMVARFSSGSTGLRGTLHHREKISSAETIRDVVQAGLFRKMQVSNNSLGGLHMFLMVALMGTSLIVAVLGFVLPLAAAFKGN